jgi:hypothetical protein
LLFGLQTVDQCVVRSAGVGEQLPSHDVKLFKDGVLHRTFITVD